MRNGNRGRKSPELYRSPKTRPFTNGKTTPHKNKWKPVTKEVDFMSKRSNTSLYD